MKNWIWIIIAIVFFGVYTYILRPDLFSGNIIPSNFTGINLCKPSWVALAPALDVPTKDDYCKTGCYGGMKVTSYKIENTTVGAFNQSMPYCYCDANDCNPR